MSVERGPPAWQDLLLVLRRGVPAEQGEQFGRFHVVPITPDWARLPS